jgi:hypothetical protein
MKLEWKGEFASLVLVIIYEFALRSILLCQVLAFYASGNQKRQQSNSVLDK